MIVDRLTAYWKKVERRGPEECWPWRGARTVGGYGQLWSGRRKRRQNRTCLATHIALLIDARPRPSPEHVAMHSCDNPICVNPSHLHWGTIAENNQDRVRKARGRRAATRAPSPHYAARRASAKLTDDQVRYIRRSRASSCALATELDVSDQCVLDVRARRTWRHVA